MGGTKTAAGLVASDGGVLLYETIQTRANGPADALFADIVALADRVLASGSVRAAALAGIGVGCGGPMQYPEGRVSTLNIPAWRDFPLRTRLQEQYGCPVVVDNDAKALAVAEYWIGAGRGARCLLGMVVSTGVGGGIIEDGRLLHGASGNAGHIGHVVAYRDGPPCTCGSRGCVEAVASGTGLARRALAAKQQGLLPDLPAAPTGKDLVAAARAGEPTAAQFLEEAGIAVGRGIAAVGALADVDRVVIGGGLALGAGDLLLTPLRQALAEDARLSFTRGLEERVILSDLGVAGALAGAAGLIHTLPREQDAAGLLDGFA
ncbi:MAG: ROK family protein [Chloroflexota bacterium]